MSGCCGNDPKTSPSCCGEQTPVPADQQPVNPVRYFATGAVAFCVWLAVYMSIIPVSKWVTYSLFGLAEGSELAAAVEFFVYDTAKILLLLVIMVYAIAWIRAALNVERVRDYLSGKAKTVGYLLGSGFGAITPFCSCSSIPLFLGFTMARIPVGITMAFLITSPLINEVAVVLLWGLLGWKFTVIYVCVGMVAGIVGGMFMDLLRAERWLQPFILEALAQGNDYGAAATEERKVDLQQRHSFAYSETRSIFLRVWKWVIIGVGAGALLHGYVPQEWFTENLGAGQWWSVPLSVVIGIPLYTNVTGIIPIMESLLLKGLPLGTTLAFCMSTVAVSLPEVLMLKQVMRWQLLAVFVGLMLVLFTCVGWFFNAMQPYLY